MILGCPLVLRRDVFVPGSVSLRTNELNFYVKEDWRVTKTLTLNIGLHYEINTPFTEANNYSANFNPATAIHCGTEWSQCHRQHQYRLQSDWAAYSIRLAGDAKDGIPRWLWDLL
jgi:hypothetical protein